MLSFFTARAGQTPFNAIIRLLARVTRFRGHSLKHCPRDSGFAIESVSELTVDRPLELMGYYILSPCVWKESTSYHLLTRVVNPSPTAAKKVARIHYAGGLSACHFVLDASPVIAPAPDSDDRDGCEDPTLAKVEDLFYVFYSGWNQNERVSRLLLATGPEIHRLKKEGPPLAQSPRFTNTKEATIVGCADGTWRMFFEFAEDGRSKIGIASSDEVRGPWKFGDPPLETRSNSWDSWHLSTGPVTLADPDRPVMFYNGADRDARWRIGWVQFDAAFGRITDRCEHPLIEPPVERRQPEDTDIAFAASAVQEADHVGLYYSTSDRWLWHARLRARQTPP